MSESISRKLVGSFGQMANGHPIYTILDANSEFFLKACELLRGKCDVKDLKISAVGFDEIVAECSKGGTKLLLGWDIWSGFYLGSDSEAADSIIIELGKYLDTVITKPEFDIYISAQKS